MEEKSFELIQPLPKLFISMTLDKSLKLSLPRFLNCKMKFVQLAHF